MKDTILTLVLLLAAIVACAQKSPKVPANLKTDSSLSLKNKALLEVDIKAKRANLPDIQQISLRLPDSIKANGKLALWKNQFHADNHETNLLYTIANDDDYLYFIARASDINTVRNIFGSGMILSFEKQTEGGKTDAISITYPVMERQLLFKYLPDGLNTTIKVADSIMLSNNAVVAQNCRYIGLKGIKGVDSLISVYNVDGVNVSGRFNNKLEYTYELRVSLKHLGLSATGIDKFTYHIAINGPKLKPYPGHTPHWIQQVNQKWYRKIDPTGFTGEYTLAKNNE